MKKILCVLVIFCMLFAFVGCSDKLLGASLFFFLAATGDDRADKDDVMGFVCENEEELLKAVEDGDFSAFENKGFIKDIDADETVVEFSCGGAGIGSATSYVGFYYTPENDMFAVWCAPSSDNSLTPSGTGFEWRDQIGDDWYYTEHICGSFYYYEASY